MTKSVLFVVTCMTISSISAFASSNYKCKAAPGNSNTDDQKISVLNADEVVVNDTDEGRVDGTYQSDNFVRINGFFKSLGDGQDGYSVTLLVSKSMIAGKAVGRIKVEASGEGFVEDYFACDLSK